MIEFKDRDISFAAINTRMRTQMIGDEPSHSLTIQSAISTRLRLVLVDVVEVVLSTVGLRAPSAPGSAKAAGLVLPGESLDRPGNAAFRTHFRTDLALCDRVHIEHIF